MIETHIKILASLYTAVLVGAMLSLLLFGDFTFQSPSIKGKAIEAIMIDVSQLNKSVSKKAPPNKKAPIKKDPQTKKNPPQKPPVKKDPPKKTPPVKKDPPRIVKKTPKVDTRAQELERQKQRERQKKLDDIRKKRIAAEQKRKREEQALKDLAQQTQKEVDDKISQQTPDSEKGQSEADALNKLMSQYQSAVISSVKWSRPASANNNILCHVKVRQIPGGGVIDATISSPCNASMVERNSIIAAIKRADPLPYKGFEKVFSRTATFIFQPNN